MRSCFSPSSLYNSPASSVFPCSTNASARNSTACDMGRGVSCGSGSDGNGSSVEAVSPPRPVYTWMAGTMGVNGSLNSFSKLRSGSRGHATPERLLTLEGSSTPRCCVGCGGSGAGRSYNQCCSLICLVRCQVDAPTHSTSSCPRPFAPGRATRRNHLHPQALLFRPSVCSISAHHASSLAH